MVLFTWPILANNIILKKRMLMIDRPDKRMSNLSDITNGNKVCFYNFLHVYTAHEHFWKAVNLSVAKTGRKTKYIQKHFAILNTTNKEIDSFIMWRHLWFESSDKLSFRFHIELLSPGSLILKVDKHLAIILNYELFPHDICWRMINKIKCCIFRIISLRCIIIS